MIKVLSTCLRPSQMVGLVVKSTAAFSSELLAKVQDSGVGGGVQGGRTKLAWARTGPGGRILTRFEHSVETGPFPSDVSDGAETKSDHFSDCSGVSESSSRSEAGSLKGQRVFSNPLNWSPSLLSTRPIVVHSVGDGDTGLISERDKDRLGVLCR